MVSDFSRIITLLRKEKGVTQKQAAEDLGVSQALLSHYEKGIRECGLEFVVRVADYYGAGPKNTSSMFGVKKNLYGGYSDAAMHIAESNVKAILAGEDIGLGAPLKDTSAFAMTTESLSRDYPLYATSLLNLIKTSEARIEKEK